MFEPLDFCHGSSYTLCEASYLALNVDYENDSVEEIVSKLEYAIEQHPSFLKVIPSDAIKEMEELNKKRAY